MVHVYTKPDCPACELTKKHLERLAIPFTEYGIDADPGIVSAARELGISAAPIVVAITEHRGDEMWGGYRPDSIGKLVFPVE